MAIQQPAAAHTAHVELFTHRPWLHLPPEVLQQLTHAVVAHAGCQHQLVRRIACRQLNRQENMPVQLLGSICQRFQGAL